jgi:hypothetical protein
MVQYIVLVAVIALGGIAAFADFGRAASHTIEQQGPNVARMGF